jgi:hypothetical protein
VDMEDQRGYVTCLAKATWIECSTGVEPQWKRRPVWRQRDGRAAATVQAEQQAWHAWPDGGSA